MPSYDAWDGLSLTYDIKWPLHILLTPEVRPHQVSVCFGT